MRMALNYTLKNLESMTGIKKRACWLDGRVYSKPGRRGFRATFPRVPIFDRQKRRRTDQKQGQFLKLMGIEQLAGLRRIQRKAFLRLQDMVFRPPSYQQGPLQHMP